MIREIIKKSPYFIQQPIRIMFNKMPYVVQYGRVFNDTYKFLQQSQNWTKERLQNYQLKKIRELLNFCYDYVPFYQKKWNDYGINVKTIKDFEDFKKLPFTTKQELINNSEEFIPTVFDREKLIRTRSGGTTGSPANFYETQESIDKELAFYTRYWICNGYDFSKRII
jgi:phenylacetate-CoA ligase